MIAMKDFMEAIDYQITSGGVFGWICYGLDSYILDHEPSINSYTVSIVFDTKTKVVYEASLCDYNNDCAYRLMNPDFKDAYLEEEQNEGFEPDQAWDDVKYVNMDNDQEFLDMVKSYVTG